MSNDALNLRIDTELSAIRPDRYEPGGDWLRPVIDLIADDMSVFEARQIAAETIVRRREAEATKRVNRMLKFLMSSGQYSLPIDWFLYANEPVAFEREDDKGVMRRVRVCLRAMTSDDWRDFSLHGRVAAQHRIDAEMAMYDAADWIAHQQAGETFAQWAEATSPIPRDELA